MMTWWTDVIKHVGPGLIRGAISLWRRFSTAASFRAKRYRGPRRDLWPLSAPAVTHTLRSNPPSGPPRPPETFVFLLVTRTRSSGRFQFYLSRLRNPPGPCFISMQRTWTRNGPYRSRLACIRARPKCTPLPYSAREWHSQEETSVLPHVTGASPGPYRILCHTPIILSLSPLKNLLRSGCSLVYLATIYLELDVFDGVLVDLRLLCYAITAPEHSSTLYGLTNSYLPHSGFPKYLYNVVTTVTARIS